MSCTIPPCSTNPKGIGERFSGSASRSGRNIMSNGWMRLKVRTLSLSLFLSLSHTHPPTHTHTHTGVEVELLNLDAVISSLKKIPRHKGKYAAFWYKGIQRIVYRDVVEDTLDLRRDWPLCPDHLDKPDLWERIPYSKWNSWPW